MSPRRRSGLGLAAALALLAGCSGHGREDQSFDVQPDAPVPRTTWALGHRVVESGGLHITSGGAGQDGEWTGVSLRQDQGESCSVTLSVPGRGGPDQKVGEHVRTEFEGHPAVRDGAGAEGPYLMWQVQHGSWVEVACDDPRSTDGVAAAVRLTRSSILLPFRVAALPEGYRVAQILQDRAAGTTDVYVGRAQPQLGGLPDSDLQLTLRGDGEKGGLSGRAVTVAGLPAVLSEDPRHPQVCVSVQTRHACVGVTTSDTGPYPDRSADVPTLLAIAEQLHYASDLGDRSTWFPAEDVFG